MVQTETSFEATLKHMNIENFVTDKRFETQGCAEAEGSVDTLCSKEIVILSYLIARSTCSVVNAGWRLLQT